MHSIDKTEVLTRIPPFIREHFDHFSTCDTCQRIFWKGSHWQRMLSQLDECMAGSQPPERFI
ncbi:MAG: Mut7-C RNAse domain-containing protein [Nitrosospira sp.]